MTAIKQAIKDLAKSGDEVYSIVGKVTAVDKSNNTVDVTPINGDAEILEVRLQSQLADDKGIVVYPTNGSIVIATFVNEVTAYVAMCSEVDQLIMTVGNQKLRIDNSGIAHSSATADLSDTVMKLITLMNDLFTNLQTFKVISNVPGAPSGAVFPDNLIKLAKSKVDLTVIETQFKSLLNGY